MAVAQAVMAPIRRLLWLILLGVAMVSTGPAAAQDLVSAIDQYLNTAGIAGPSTDVTSLVSGYINVGQKEAVAKSTLLSDGFKLVRSDPHRYYWNIKDETGSQYYLAFEQTRNNQIITTLTYTIELGVKDGAVCWEHAVVVGGTL